MRIARLSLRSSARPRVALERDGFLYDVEELERELGASLPIPCDPWDFHGRVVALGCAGLADLDQKLLKGHRPASSVIGPSGFAWLAPCDTDRASYVHFDPGTKAIRMGHGPSLFGQDALVDLLGEETHPDFEVGVAALLGDDLRDASNAEAKHAIAGLTILVDWCSRDTERCAPPHASSKGLRTQLGPVLVPPAALGPLRALRVTATIGGRGTLDLGQLGDLGSLEESITALSQRVPLRAGDVVGVGPLPKGSCASHELSLGMHEQVGIAVERLGTLRGAAVPRRARTGP